MPLQFYSGLSGLQLQVPKSQFPAEYREASRLTYYASFFNSIEINSSFYKIPMGSTVRKWALSVPDPFRFTFKLWKNITHNKNLEFAESDVKKCIAVLDEVNEKKGCLLIQFPPGLHSGNVQALIHLLRTVKVYQSAIPWQTSVEFRNRSWYTEEIYEILQDYNVSLVIQDIPVSSTPFVNSTNNFVYVRFHGPSGNYRESYSNAFLSEYASYINEWINEKKTVYVYFNNTMGDAFNNLVTLNKSVSEYSLNYSS